MHAYIVFAHPTRRSFTGAVLEALCRGLDEGGHTFEVGDLYAMEFRSDMTLAEYEREMNLHGDRARSLLPDDVIAEHEKIARADGVAFVFPVWWSDCPAKLKGRFDRVWVCGYAYDYDIPGETFPVPAAVDRQGAGAVPRWQYGRRPGTVGCRREHAADLCQRPPAAGPRRCPVRVRSAVRHGGSADRGAGERAQPGDRASLRQELPYRGGGVTRSRCTPPCGGLRHCAGPPPPLHGSNRPSAGASWCFPHDGLADSRPGRLSAVRSARPTVRRARALHLPALAARQP